VHALFIVKLQKIDVFEHFPQMRLHSCRVLRLREDLQQVVVGKEVKPRKFFPF
jgi:hypothetical protein